MATGPETVIAAPDAFDTARMTAARLSASDLADLTALHLDPEVSRYLGGVRTPEATRAYLEVNIGHWSEHGFGLYTLRTREGAYAGRAGLRPLEVNGAPEIEIAYTLTRPLWGQGLASEVAEALTTLGLKTLALPSLVGVVMTGNAASCRVLEKAGYRLEGSTALHGEACVLYRRRAADAEAA